MVYMLKQSKMKYKCNNNKILDILITQNKFFKCFIKSMRNTGKKPGITFRVVRTHNKFTRGRLYKVSIDVKRELAE